MNRRPRPRRRAPRPRRSISIALLASSLAFCVASLILVWNVAQVGEEPARPEVASSETPRQAEVPASASGKETVAPRQRRSEEHPREFARWAEAPACEEDAPVTPAVREAPKPEAPAREQQVEAEAEGPSLDHPAMPAAAPEPPSVEEIAVEVERFIAREDFASAGGAYDRSRGVDLDRGSLDLRLRIALGTRFCSVVAEAERLASIPDPDWAEPFAAYEALARRLACGSDLAASAAAARDRIETELTARLARTILYDVDASPFPSPHRERIEGLAAGGFRARRGEFFVAPLEELAAEFRPQVLGVLEFRLEVATRTYSGTGPDGRPVAVEIPGAVCPRVRFLGPFGPGGERGLSGWALALESYRHKGPIAYTEALPQRFQASKLDEVRARVLEDLGRRMATSLEDQIGYWPTFAVRRR